MARFKGIKHSMTDMSVWCKIFMLTDATHYNMADEKFCLKNAALK